MVYLENDSTYIQRVYIPRDDEPTAATTGHTFALQRKDYTVTENGTIRIHPDAGYDGISGGTIGTYVSAATGVTFEHLTVEGNGLYVPTGDSVYSGVTVNVDLEGPFNSGYTSGYTSGETHQKSLLSAVTLTENGRTTYQNGVSAVTVSIDTASTYQDGYESGVTHQKNLLSAETFTLNGNYNRTNGISAITVNVDTASTYQAGYDSGVTHQKSLLSSVTITQPSTSITRENGWSAVTTNIDTTPYYDSGYTDGFASGFTSGETSQKSLLSTTSITTNGFFANEDGWSSVTFNYPLYSSGFATITENGRYNYDFQTVMGFTGAWTNVMVEVAVPQTGGTGVLDSLVVSENSRAYYPPQGIDGYSAVTVAIDTSSVFNSGYTSGVTDGRNEGYTSGVTDGMASQKALLSSTAITSNGTFTRENGWSAVTVNVPSTQTVVLTQAQYDALTVKDNNTIYLING